MANELIRACPVCGLEVEQTCEHEGVDYSATDMDWQTAQALRSDMAADLQAQLETYDDELRAMLQWQTYLAGYLEAWAAAGGDRNVPDLPQRADRAYRAWLCTVDNPVVNRPAD